MSFARLFPHSRSLRVGVSLVALTVGMGIAGTGTASANSRWIAGFDNASLNSDAHSIKYNNSCYAVDRSGVFTIPKDNDGVSRVLVTGGAQFTVQAWQGANCDGGASSERVTFTIPVNDDKNRTGLNCKEIMLKVKNVGIADPIYLSCS
ncbi:hypothetical protein ABZX85_31165 [Streptomyces sp. NPDC004539]|uniref:hypothetical protein n=1 Tax=Streptomyces sp. NPDC004539 TaxID=3154280 RepID=UPI0033B5C263